MPERLVASGYAQILDALPTEITVIDRAGFIIYVNRSWIEFAIGENGSDKEINPIGQNYLAVCDADPAAAVFATGIRAVLSGEIPVYSTRYRCHGPDAYRVFLLHVTGISTPLEGAVVSHVKYPDPDAYDLEVNEGLPGGGILPLSKALAGVEPLSQTSPHVFQDLVNLYASIIEEAVDAALRNQPRTISDHLHALGRQLIRERATAKDAVQMHVAALKQQVAGRPGRATGYVEEARFLLIELLGTMVARYRMQSIGHRAVDNSEALLNSSSGKPITP